MSSLGLCCVNLKDNKALMKMGLGLVLVGHVNFLLGALVHGAVLRHINVHDVARAMVYAIANVIAIVAGLFGIISGITAIVLSKNKKNKGLKWILLVFSFVAGLLAAASTLGLMVSMVKAIIHGGRSLLTHCKNLDALIIVDAFSSITNECPFDPTRIYGTTVILWVPLIVMSVVEMVFSFRCFAACTSFLRMCRRRRPIQARRVRIQRHDEVASSSSPPPATPPPEPEPETETDAEATEQHELLECNATSERSDWL